MLRFTDLSVRTKFLVTLAIPVIGLVLLIGRQLFGSIERQDVLTYFRNQSVYLEQLTLCIDSFQSEKTAAFELLNEPERNNTYLLRCENSDSLFTVLAAPIQPLDSEVEKEVLASKMRETRNLVLLRKISEIRTIEDYESFEKELVNELERVGKLALYPDTKDRLYAHLSLANARQVLSSLRLRIQNVIDAEPDQRQQAELLFIAKQANEFEAAIRLFERDASADILQFHGSRFDEELAQLRNLLGLAREKGTAMEFASQATDWYELSESVLRGLGDVQNQSLLQIRGDNDSLLSNARLRLWLTLIALALVVLSVTVLGILLTRTIKENVEEIATASEGLAVGDIRGTVPVRSNDEFGQLARVFNGLIDNIRSLSRSAEAIGKGNYDTPVTVRSQHDTLGLALSRMRDNLRAARVRNEEQSRILQEEKDKLEQANDNVKILIKEIHHRVKNNLQVIVSLLRMQSMNITDPGLQGVFDQTQTRVRSMALIHEKLYQGSDLAQVDVRKYLEELFMELVQINNVTDKVRYQIDLPEGFELDLNTMVPIGLMMNELITNSFKHAFKDKEGGSVQLSMKSHGEGMYTLVYSDNGSGMPENFDPEESRTLGVVLIESLVEQLNGELEFGKLLDGTGTKVTVNFKPS